MSGLASAARCNESMRSVIYYPVGKSTGLEYLSVPEVLITLQMLSMDIEWIFTGSRFALLSVKGHD